MAHDPDDKSLATRLFPLTKAEEKAEKEKDYKRHDPSRFVWEDGDFDLYTPEEAAKAFPDVPELQVQPTATPHDTGGRPVQKNEDVESKGIKFITRPLTKEGLEEARRSFGLAPSVPDDEV